MRRMRLCGIGLAVTASCLHLQAVPLAHSLSRHPAPGAATVVAVLEEPLPLANHAQASAATSDPSATDAQRALLKRYCITCHNEKLKTAGLMLDRLDVERVGEGAETWEKVVRLHVRFQAKAGRRLVGVAFMKTSALVGPTRSSCTKVKKCGGDDPSPKGIG